MYRLPMFLVLAVAGSGCDDSPSGPGDGSLLGSTSITGAEPDPDGYRLTVDGEPMLTLAPKDSKELALEPGRYTLDLEGPDAHCQIEMALPLEVEVEGQGQMPVALAVRCPATGAIVTARSMGLYIPSSYRITAIRRVR